MTKKIIILQCFLKQDEQNLQDIIVSIFIDSYDSYCAGKHSHLH